MLLYIILATVIVSLISLVGVLVIFKKQYKKSFLKILISLATGALLAVAFLDLLPEVIEEGIFEPHLIFAVVLLSIIFFFIVELVFHWHHCRCEDHNKLETRNKKNLVYINLVGDAIHNFVDGALIASAFLLDFHTGIIVTLAVIIHEIPQEISDFGVLLYAGLSRTKAILYNLLVALVAVVGALTFYYFGNSLQSIISLVIAFAAGNFIYLAASDLIPEIHHELDHKKIFWHVIWLLIGVALIYLAGQILPHGH